MEITELIRPLVADLEPYTPGTSYEELAERLGCDPEEIVKLDANENPYGPPPGVHAALAELCGLHRYPDIENRRLRKALAGFTSIPARYVVVGAGSDELLTLITDLLLDAGDAIVTLPPTFSMYAFNAQLAGARVLKVPRRSGFAPDLETLRATVVRERPKVLFVCSPNNPTGRALSDAELEALLEFPLVVVLDEAYVEFADAPSRIGWVPERDNLVVLRTFSKWAGLAGLRVGYGAFPKTLLSHVWKIKEPYTVSAAGTAAALAVLADPDYLPKHRARILAERERLWCVLDEITYLRPTPSQANFVFCEVTGRDPVELRRTLEAQGILVRFYSGDMAQWIRIGVGRPEENEKLIAALRGLEVGG